MKNYNSFTQAGWEDPYKTNKDLFQQQQQIASNNATQTYVPGGYNPSPSKAQLLAEQQMMWQTAQRLRASADAPMQQHEEEKQPEPGLASPTQIIRPKGLNPRPSYASAIGAIQAMAQAPTQAQTQDEDKENLNVANLASESATPHDTPMQPAEEKITAGFTPQYPKGRKKDKKKGPDHEMDSIYSQLE